MPLAGADEEGDLVNENVLLEANAKDDDEFLQNDGVYCHGDVLEHNSRLDSSRSVMCDEQSHEAARAAVITPTLEPMVS